jgi:hypothetical protein
MRFLVMGNSSSMSISENIRVRMSLNRKVFEKRISKLKKRGVELLSPNSPPLSELLEELGDLTLCELNELTAVWLANVQIEATLAMAGSRRQRPKV